MQRQDMTRTEATPLFDRMMRWSLDRPLPALARYAIATGGIVATALVRALLVTSLVPWLLFIPPIVAVALMLGEGAGLYATLLAAFLAALTIGSVAEPFYLTGPQYAGSILFVLVAGCLVRLAGELRAGLQRAHEVNIAIRDREAFLSGVLASSTDCIKVIDLDGRLSFMSEGGMKVMEVSDFNTIKGCPWPDFWQDAGNEEAKAALDRARQGLTSHFIGEASTFLGRPNGGTSRSRRSLARTAYPRGSCRCRATPPI